MLRVPLSAGQPGPCCVLALVIPLGQTGSAVDSQGCRHEKRCAGSHAGEPGRCLWDAGAIKELGGEVSAGQGGHCKAEGAAEGTQPC